VFVSVRPVDAQRGLDEDVTPTELAAIERWRRSLAQVALEEMLHLSLVNNLLAAIGAAPHLWRPAFPVRPGHFPSGILMSLTPFGEAALDHFMYIERPRASDCDGAGFGHATHYRRVARPDMLAPSPQDYASQGHLYHGVLEGLARLCEQLGEERVFVGHGQAQVSIEEFGLPGLFKIADLASARAAIEQIVLQGEERQRTARTRTSPASKPSEVNSANCAPRGPGSSLHGPSSAIRCWAAPASRATACMSSSRLPGRCSTSAIRSMH